MRQGFWGADATLALPRAERRALLKALFSLEADLRPALNAVQTARHDAVTAITARPYDSAKAAKALDDLRAALGTLMQQAQSVVLNDLAQRAGP